MVVELQQIEALALELAALHPADIIKRAQQEYGDDLSISFSGAEDVVLIDMASRTGLPFRAFTLDTGRLHPQTYKFMEQVRDRYDRQNWMAYTANYDRVRLPDERSATVLVFREGRTMMRSPAFTVPAATVPENPRKSRFGRLTHCTG